MKTQDQQIERVKENKKVQTQLQMYREARTIICVSEESIINLHKELKRLEDKLDAAKLARYGVRENLTILSAKLSSSQIRWIKSELQKIEAE